MGLLFWFIHSTRVTRVMENITGSRLPEPALPDPLPYYNSPSRLQMLRMQDQLYRNQMFPVDDMYRVERIAAVRNAELFPPVPRLMRPITQVIPGLHNYDDGNYTKIGYVFNENNEKYRLPLFEKRDYLSSNRDYRYYVLDHTNYQNKIRLDFKNYMSDGDKIKIPGYPGEFNVQLYDHDFPQFHPNVIGSLGGPMLPFGLN